MSSPAHAFVDRWKATVDARDVGGLESLLAEDVVFRSPVVHAPTVGRGPTTLLLAAVMEVFGELEYTHVYVEEPRGVTLQFETSVLPTTAGGSTWRAWTCSASTTRAGSPR